MKPISPNPTVDRTATHTYEFLRSTHRSVGVIAAPKISNPPMVGVPAFGRCVSGPSRRPTWPICDRRSRRMTHGPSANMKTNAVRLAAAVRNVMYCITLSTDHSVCNGYSK